MAIPTRRLSVRRTRDIGRKSGTAARRGSRSGAGGLCRRRGNRCLPHREGRHCRYRHGGGRNPWPSHGHGAKSRQASGERPAYGGGERNG